MVDATIEGYDSYEDARRRPARRADPRRARGQRHALLLGHHRPTQGRAESAPARERRRDAAGPPLLVQGLYKADESSRSTSRRRRSTTRRRCASTWPSSGSAAPCVVMEQFDAIEALQLIEKYRVTHSQWVPTMFVRMLKLPDEERRPLRRLEPAGRDPRRGALPDPGEGADDRLVGSGAPRVLRGHRGQRLLRHRLRGVARPQGLGRESPAAASSTSSTTTGNELPTGEIGTIYFARAAPTSSTTTTRRRRQRLAQREGLDARSATSATSTRTATST